MNDFTIAIIGRPNVGKSTLFNRLVGKNLAIVDDRPGVTRDRREAMGSLGGLSFRLFDTAGLEDAQDDSIEGRMRRQTEQALEHADLALMLFDARAGLTPLDEHFARWLRRGKKPVVLVANKCEGERAAMAGLAEAYGLGLGEPVAISAAHGEGLADLVEVLMPHMAAAEQAAKAQGGFLEEDAYLSKDEEFALAEAEGDAEAFRKRPLQLAIIGRPNAGKSTLINRFLGEDRLLTGPEPGITRDSIAVDWVYEGRPLKFVDTAGMRRRTRVTERLEKLSVADSLRALRFAHVVTLLVDATQPLEHQDFVLARRVVEEGRALVIGVNKWDQVENPQALLKTLRDKLEINLPHVRGVPLVTLSALTGRNMQKLLDAVFEIYEHWNARIPTSELNRWLEDAVSQHAPPADKGRRVKLRYMTQVKTRPPTFALFTQRAGALPDSYMKYLINGLRQDFDLPGVPIRIMLRKPKNPYVDKS